MVLPAHCVAAGRAAPRFVDRITYSQPTLHLVNIRLPADPIQHRPQGFGRSHHRDGVAIDPRQAFRACLFLGPAGLHARNLMIYVNSHGHHS